MSLIFQNLITPEMVTRERTLIDPCGFYSVMSHYFNEMSEITEVHVLAPSLDLAEVGAFYKSCEASRQEMAAAIRELLEKQLIRNADPMPRRTIFGHYGLSFSEIGVESEVRVLYAPPYYLVQPTGEVWR